MSAPEPAKNTALASLRNLVSSGKGSYMPISGVRPVCTVNKTTDTRVVLPQSTTESRNQNYQTLLKPAIAE